MMKLFVVILLFVTTLYAQNLSPTNPPLVELNITEQQFVELKGLLPQPGRTGATQQLQGNQKQIEAIVGADGYKKLLDWYGKHTPQPKQPTGAGKVK
jgi:hypothetical protein